MPRGIAESAQRDPANFTLAEWQRAKRQGVDPRWLKQSVQECWKLSDSDRAFNRALSERGLFLARGDKRGFVVLDHDGEVHSLPRLLDIKTKEVRARLGDGTDLRGVDETKKLIGEKMSPAIRRHIAESRARFSKRAATLDQYKAEMTQAHRAARAKLDQRQKSEWDTGTGARTARLPKGLLGLWHRLTGKYQEILSQNEAEANATRLRHVLERQELIDTQLNQRAVLQAQIKELRNRQAGLLAELRQDVGRYLSFKRGQDGPARSRDLSLDLKLQR
jgi:hypothetical protein